MRYLRQSTAVKVVVGPFVDATDGLTPETGVTLGAADAAEIIKHDQSAVEDISSNTFTAITDAGGLYNLSLSASNTGTLGMLSVYVADTSVCRPVFAEFMVIPANIWDSWFSTDIQEVDVTYINGNAASGFLSGTDLLRSDVTKISGSATAADNMEAGALGVVSSSCGSGSTTTGVVTNLTEATNDHYNGRLIVFTSGALAGQSSTITDYNGSTKTLTVAALTEAPVSADTFVIV